MVRAVIQSVQKLPVTWLILPGVVLFFWLAMSSLVDDSPTMDEQNHLARGVALLFTGDPRLSVEHPPVGNLLSALPLLMLDDLHLPTDHPSWQQVDGWYLFADQFLWHANQDVTRMIFLGRLSMLFVTLALALTGFHFGRELWGKPAGLFTFHFLLFDPNLLAHGRYITTDVVGTWGILLATYLLWRMWRLPNWSWTHVLVAACGLGIAFGSKLSNLAFVPLLFLLACAAAQAPVGSAKWWRESGRRALQLVVAGALSIGVLWVLFGFEWASFRFANSENAFLSALNARQGPLPTFWLGVERMLDLGTASGRTSFLLGETSVTGFPAYFPIAFLVKNPLALLLLLPAALILLIWQPATRQRALFLLLPIVGFFGIMLTNSLNIGFRHLLPMIPFIYLLIAGLTVLPLPGRWQYRLPAGGLALLLLATLWIHPHYISFFNVAAGGPANGHNILIDSNVDWGQDLLRLQQWMAEEEIETIKLGWFGTAQPEYYGIPYEPLPGFPYNLHLFWDVPFDIEAPADGIYVISASILWELPLQEKGVFAYFRAREPDLRIGYSLFVYQVGDGPLTVD